MAIFHVGAFAAVVAIALFAQERRGQGVGLLTAYLAQISVLHGLAAVLYLSPGYAYYEPRTVIAGLDISTVAIMGLTLGACVVWFRRQSAISGKPTATTPELRRVALYGAIGAGAYTLMLLNVGRLPTVYSVIVATSGFALAALVLLAVRAIVLKSRSGLALSLGLAGCLPFMTVASQGFMGYGLAATAVVFTSVIALTGLNRTRILIILIAFYGGVSLYVTYMRDREDIRDSIARGARTSSRVEMVRSTFTEFEFFDPRNPDHLERIDMRLNQDYFVGVAAEELAVGHVDYAGGSTFVEAAAALVPRAVWPNKPFAAGSGDLVTRFTGISFPEGTSVGIGQVMEFYINFGYLGVAGGFFVLGWALASLDRGAISAMRIGDWGGFMVAYLPGVALLQIGGSLGEMTSSAAAAWAAALLVGRVSEVFIAPTRSAVRTGARQRRGRR